MTAQALALRPHPTETVDESWWLTARLARSGTRLAADFRLEGDTAGLQLPPPAPAQRGDGLWRHTCFELFIGAADAPAYCEFNFAPSGQWAGYAFASTRVPDGSAALIESPRCEWRRGDAELAARVELDLDRLGLAAVPLRAGVSAVLEARDGRLSHWALEHSREVPDFHDPGAFVVRLT